MKEVTDFRNKTIRKSLLSGFVKHLMRLSISGMGFTASPQGLAAHEALLNRQDAELKMLNTIRCCLMMKAKSDREYSQCLLTTVLHGQKIDQGDDMSGSVVVEAWKSLIEQYEYTAKHIKRNSEILEIKVINKINELCQEKRKCIKLYQDDYSRLIFQLNKLNDDVSRKKLEYQKCSETHKTTKSKLEEFFSKGGCRSNKKFEELKEKYQKSCKRLHQVHNEYVLSLTEAVEFERDYRTTLLPELLNNQLNIEEEQVQTLKLVLEELWKSSSLSTDQLQDLETRVWTIIEGVSPEEEYNSFTEKYHNLQPVKTQYMFDNTLLETGSKLQANKLTVDNLTVDWLKNKASELELKISEERIKMKQVEDVLMIDSKNGDTLKRLHPDSSYTMKKLEVTELRTIERKLKRQLELIKESLNEIGCEEIPSGYDINLENGFIESSTTENGQVKALVDEEWFHGVLPREEVVRLLTREGDYLVRETTRNDEDQTVLSVAWGGHKHFIVQITPEGQYRFEGPSFPTISELITYQCSSGLPVTSRSGAILRKPILRERWELNNDDVILVEKVGRGNFGDVYKAKLKSSGEDVAVKTCRMTLPDEHKRKFLQEGRILKQYDHPNIVKLIGICVQKQPIMIVMELVPGGSLLTFLRNKGPGLSQAKLLKMCKDTAAGMRYLESRNCIHRDLAARNCLIGYEDMVKISDFGMSREEEEYTVSDGMKQIPIKWTAPEALNFGKYTSLCDVWSYGVLAWEIFSTGDVPYTGLSNSKAREQIDKGYRMPAPEGTPDEMYHLMLKCWEYDPDSRPHFDEIYNVVSNLYTLLFPK